MDLFDQTLFLKTKAEKQQSKSAAKTGFASMCIAPFRMLSPLEGPDQLLEKKRTSNFQLIFLSSVNFEAGIARKDWTFELQKLKRAVVCVCVSRCLGGGGSRGIA